MKKLLFLYLKIVPYKMVPLPKHKLFLKQPNVGTIEFILFLFLSISKINK